MKGSLVASCLVGPLLVARAATFEVAPEGSDANPGSAERPFATLARARDAVRELKRSGGLPDSSLRKYAASSVKYPVSWKVKLNLNMQNALRSQLPVHRAKCLYRHLWLLRFHC